MTMERKSTPRTPLDGALGKFQSIADALWVKLTHLRETTGRACILFTAAEPGSGTTVITATTAMALVRTLRVPVQVIETSVERPGLAGYLDLRTAPGLSDLLDGHCAIKDCWQEVHSIKGLSVISGGRARPSVQGELASESGARILDELCSRGPFTLIDAPPLLGHSYAQPLLARASGVVVVVRARSTRIAPAEATVRMLEESGVNVLGSVLNRFKSDMPFGIGEKY